MDDKDEIGEAKGSEDVLRPGRPGGQRVEPGDVGDEPASGTVEDPIHPGETQPGEVVEQAQLRGGPIDIAPERVKGGR